MQDHNAPPLNPLPPVVWALALPMIALEIVLQAGAAGLAGGPDAVGWRIDAITKAAFVPDLWREMLSLGQYPPEHMARFIAYPFVHGNLTHTAFAVVILLALGKFTAEVLRFWAVLVVFFGAAIAGALAYGLLTTPVPLFGAYPGDYGLVGAFTYLMWLRLAGSGREYRAFSMIGLLLAAQLVFGVFLGGGLDWVADLAGFAAGFAITILVAPGGIARLAQRLRQR
ncbi:MAG: rhomboid family intramembrane serine protease [Rhodobacteraceae bacterium]|nr:rhomboid family intramembrane serine protease [Paracoccaceae bacterium]